MQVTPPSCPTKMDTNGMDCFTIGLEVAPFDYPSPTTPRKTVPDRLLRILKKYKYNWRLAQLSKPMKIQPKFIPKEEKMPLRYDTKEEVKLDDELKFYSDQLATPALKNLIHNKVLYSKVSRKLRRNLTRNLNRAWKSIYNYYRNKEREKKLRQKKREKEQKKTAAKPKQFERAETLAKPKPVFKPPPPPPSRKFKNFGNLDTLAAPKVYVIQPPKRVGVNPHALTYEPTEVIFRLAKLPKRFENLPKNLVPGSVKKSALRYKITPRVEALCVPKTTREKAKDDDDFNPWAIPKNALKYKATPRILNLAKPKGS